MILQYNISTCFPNMNTLACTALQQSLTKKVFIQNTERKKVGQIQERISIRMLVRILIIQFIIINLHTKYDSSSLHCFNMSIQALTKIII